MDMLGPRRKRRPLPSHHYILDTPEVGFSTHVVREAEDIVTCAYHQPGHYLEHRGIAGYCWSFYKYTG